MFIQKLARFITSHFKAVFFVAMLITGIFGYFAQYLSIDASAETLLVENDKDLKLTREVHARYQSADILIVSFSPKAYLLDDATLKTIKDLKADLLKIDGVENVTTLLDVPLLESPPRSIKEAISDVRTLTSPDINKTMVQNELMTSPLYASNLVSEDFKTTAIVIQLKDDTKYMELLNNRNHFSELSQKRALTKQEEEAYEKAQDTFKAYRDIARPQMHQLISHVRETLKTYHQSGDLFLGGVMMIADDMITFVKSDIVIYGSAIIIIMILVLWMIFRQLRFVVLPIFIAFVAVLITTGVNALLDLEVTVISSNYVAMQLITTLSLVIHLIVSYREEYALFPNASQQELLVLTLKRMSIPSLFVILTSIAGFGSLLSCAIVPVIDFGIMMNIGISVSLLSALVLFPTLMMFLKKRDPVLTFDHKFRLTQIFAHTVEHRAKWIIGSFTLLTCFSLYGMTQLVVENSFINYFKKSTEIYKGMEKIDNSLGGTTPLEIVVTFPKTFSDAPAPKKAASDSLDSFEDEFSSMDNKAQYWFTSQKIDTILKVHDYLLSLPQIGHVSSLGTMAKVGRILKQGQDFDGVEWALLYNELSPENKKILITPFVNIEHNEARFVVRIIDSNPNLRRNELLEQIQTELHTKVGLDPESYHLVGMMVLYNNMLQSLFSSQISTLAWAALALGAMFLILFRSFKIASVAMIVNVVPVSIIFGIMGVARIPLDMMSITIASISLGIAVDNTIHYYYRFREELAIDGNYLASMHRAHGTIGFGMFYYAFATLIGFLVLVTSNFIPTMIFGLLIVLVLVIALLSDLLLSPLLVILLKPFGKGKLKN